MSLPPARPFLLLVAVLRGSCPAPSPYSSPGAWSDGTVGAVDLHDSEEAMNKAFEWQANDKKWSDLYDQVAAACGITVEDFEVVSLTAR